MTVYSYVVANDGGFAPNPFHGFCTLACCKPLIRRKAKPGDLIVGLASGGKRVVYAMRVSEVMSIASYWSDRRFRKKRPTGESKEARYGDNIYQPIGGGAFKRQHNAIHRERDKKHDLSGDNVLVARRFAYFGSRTRTLPNGLSFLAVGRGHRSRFTAKQIGSVERWFDKLPQGQHSKPTLWTTDEEKKLAQRRCDDPTCDAHACRPLVLACD